MPEEVEPAGTPLVYYFQSSSLTTALYHKAMPAREAGMEGTIQRGLGYGTNCISSSSLLLISMMIVLLPSLWAL